MCVTCIIHVHGVEAIERWVQLTRNNVFESVFLPVDWQLSTVCRVDILFSVLSRLCLETLRREEGERREGGEREYIM